MKTLLGFLLALVLVTSGCQTTTGEHDPVRTEHVASGVNLFVSSPISALLIQTKEKNPQKAEVKAAYLRSIGSVFCEIQRTKTFDPIALESKLNLIFTDLVKDDIEVLLIKNGILGLYGTFFVVRTRAELPEDNWMTHVAGVFCTGIGRGLVDSGFEGITPAP